VEVGLMKTLGFSGSGTEEKIMLSVEAGLMKNSFHENQLPLWQEFFHLSTI